MSDEELDDQIEETARRLQELRGERIRRRRADWRENPFRVGDRIRTPNLVLPYVTVSRVNPRSLVTEPYMRIPVERAILVERPQTMGS